MNGIPRLKELLNAFQAPWDVAAAIAVGSAALLLLRLLLRWQGITDLEALPPWVFGIVWIVLICAGVILLIRALKAVGIWIKRLNKRRKRRKWINENLDTLSDEERQVFKYMLENSQRSLTGRLAASDYFGPLVQKGLLIRAEGTFNMMNWPHTVPEDVWKELIRRRDEFIR